MSWTRPADLRLQVQKLWDKGDLLRANVHGHALLPMRLRLSGPSSAELSQRFDEVRTWMAELQQAANPRGTPRLRIALREFRHRVLGTNAVPEEVWLDTLDDALALTGKHKEFERFTRLVQQTRERQPCLLPWLEKRPLAALELCEAWARLLDVVAWLQAHPRPSIYLRQVDLPGVDSKFMEAQRGVLAELLDLALPPQAINPAATGVGQFCCRYGFRDKPLRIRFRLLDSRLALLTGGFEQDIAVTQSAFERLNVAVRRVFITENEVNFLAFPPAACSMVVFGAGYGFEVLAGANWLQQCEVFYWGDIDTHGFAILNQLRAYLPKTQSLLMDRDTLLAHKTQWGEEPRPLLHDLPRLTAQEGALFNALRDNQLTPRLRLEQERIGFGWLQSALMALPLNGCAS